jgi:Tfp pilus assembly pilus retraction ATPase PilT
MKKSFQWQDVVKIFEADEVHEIILSAGHSPSQRKAGRWVDLPYAAIAPESLQEFLFQKFGRASVAAFETSGLLRINDLSSGLAFVATKSMQGARIHIAKISKNIQITDFNVPAAYQELLTRSEGVHLICGPSLSGKSSFAFAMGQTISANGRSVAFFTDDTGVSAGQNLEVYDLNTLELGLSALRGFDNVVLDIKSESSWIHAVRIAESGLPVLAVSSISGLQRAIRAFSENICSAHRNLETISNQRFFQLLQSGLSLRLLPGVEGAHQLGFELLLVNNNIRTHLLSGEWALVQKEMFALSDKSGMRTLNQCLLNLMLKRKIDFKVGFANSPDPEELDQLLHQVGI